MEPWQGNKKKNRKALKKKRPENDEEKIMVISVGQQSWWTAQHGEAISKEKINITFYCKLNCKSFYFMHHKEFTPGMEQRVSI